MATFSTASCSALTSPSSAVISDCSWSSCKCQLIDPRLRREVGVGRGVGPLAGVGDLLRRLLGFGVFGAPDRGRQERRENTNRRQNQPESDASRCAGYQWIWPCYRHLLTLRGDIVTFSCAEVLPSSLDVSFVRDDRTILAPLTWRVMPGQRWLVLGRQRLGQDHPAAHRRDVRASVDRRRAGAGRTARAHRRARAAPPHRLHVAVARRPTPPGAALPRHRDDREVRGAGAVVASLRRRRRGPSPAVPRTDGRRLARRSSAGHDVVGRAAASAAWPAR